MGSPRPEIKVAPSSEQVTKPKANGYTRWDIYLVLACHFPVLSLYPCNSLIVNRLFHMGGSRTSVAGGTDPQTGALNHR